MRRALLAAVAALALAGAAWTALPGRPRPAPPPLFQADALGIPPLLPATYRPLPQMAERWGEVSTRGSIAVVDLRVRSPDFGRAGGDPVSGSPGWEGTLLGSNAEARDGTNDETSPCTVRIVEDAFEAEDDDMNRTIVSFLVADGLSRDEAVDAAWSMSADHEIGHCVHRTGMHGDPAGLSGLVQEMAADGWTIALDRIRHGDDMRRSAAWMDFRMLDLVRSGMLVREHVRLEFSAVSSDGAPVQPAHRPLMSSAAVDYATPLMRDALTAFVRARSPGELIAMARTRAVDGDGVARNALGTEIARIVLDARDRFSGADAPGPAGLAEGMFATRMVDGVLVLGERTPGFFRHGIEETAERREWRPSYAVEPDLGRVRSLRGEWEIDRAMRGFLADLRATPYESAFSGPPLRGIRVAR